MLQSIFHPFVSLSHVPSSTTVHFMAMISIEY